MKTLTGRPRLLAGLAVGLAATVGLAGWATATATATARAPHGPSRPRPVIVLASASLGPVITALIPALETATGRRIQLESAGTPTLLAQVRAGFPADLIVTADETSAKSLVATGFAEAPLLTFAYNQLAVITAPGNPKHVGSLADLEQRSLMVALAGPDVPAGRYARAAFARVHLPVPRAASEPSVDGVLTAVRTGAADAGIVYVTDARRATAGVSSLKLSLGIRSTCVAAVLRQGNDVGARLLEVLHGPLARRLLAARGFELP